MKRSTRTGGFTLLEIMLVVMIIAILVGGAVLLFGPNINFAAIVKAKGDVGTMATQLQMYNSQNGNFPSTEQGLRALVEKPTTEPIPKNWSKGGLQSVPLDPWGKAYNYQNPGTHDPAGFDLWSNGPDKQSGTSDDIGNWAEK